MGRFIGFLGADIDARIAPVWPQIVGKCAFRHIIRRQNAIYERRGVSIRKPRPSIRKQLSETKQAASPKKAAARTKKNELEV